MNNHNVTQPNILKMHPAITVNQEETAELIGVSTTTIKNYIKQGKLHPNIIGTRKLFDLDEINAFARPRNKHSQSIYLIADVDDYKTFINRVAGDVLQAIKEGSAEADPIET